MITVKTPCISDFTLSLKGQLHTHTTRSDGTRPPQQVIDEYAALGHDFIMFADHDVLGDYNGLDSHGMILIRGSEISADGPHILHVNASSQIQPEQDRQNVLDSIQQDNGFSILCHPNWQQDFNHFPQSHIENLHGYTGIEIVNGITQRGPGHHMALDRWDMLLSKGIKIWGFGNDDSHRDNDTALAWNMALVRERTQEAVINALRTGSFYVSTGVTLEEINVYGEFIRVRADRAEAMIVTGQHGRIREKVTGNELVYRIQGDDMEYVRVTAVSGPGQFAFTQPFFINKTSPGTNRSGTLQHTVSIINKPVEITGHIDDPAWDRVDPLQRFTDTATSRPSPFSPEVKLLTDRKSIFISALFPEPTVQNIKINCTNNGDPRTWSDDCIELFINTGGTRDSYHHIMINAEGCVHVSGVNCPAFPPEEITVRTSKRKYSYAIEAQIPITAFGSDTSLDNTWVFNAARNKNTNPDCVCQWSLTGTDNHVPHRFGELIYA